ncbi:hypothetical protein GCM10027422_10880 [Hymenobacter arcticus]
MPAPPVVHENTWVIQGKRGTRLGIAFGDGRPVQQLNLHDHLPAGRVPRLSNYVFDLTGMLPDAVGLDLETAGASSGFGAAGINFIGHTRGEAAARATPSGTCTTAGASTSMTTSQLPFIYAQFFARRQHGRPRQPAAGRGE